jgi:hypothetical protein
VPALAAAIDRASEVSAEAGGYTAGFSRRLFATGFSRWIAAASAMFRGLLLAGFSSGLQPSSGVPSSSIETFSSRNCVRSEAWCSFRLAM